MKLTHISHLLLATIFLGGCSKSATVPPKIGATESPAGAAVSPTAASTVPAELREAQLGATAPVHTVGTIYLAGQPSADYMNELADRGIRTVVTLRKPEELDWDQAAAVEAAGMEFVSIPFAGAEELTDDVFDRVRIVLKERGDEPLFLHCARANRVGAVWLAHRVLDEGVGIDSALEEAKIVGLRTSELIDKAKDYINRKQGDTAAEPPK